MMKLVIPIVLLIVGVGAGVGAGLVLKPEPKEHASEDATTCPEPKEQSAIVSALTEPDPEAVVPAEYAKLENQFVVPIVVDDEISSLVVLTVSIEVPAGGKDIIFLAEPKLRNNFLQVLFEHANLGGFSGNFTSSSNMRILRQDLLTAARSVVGGNARDILILDVIRQGT